MKYFVETREDPSVPLSLPWTKEGCNEWKDGAFVPYGTKALAEEAIRRRKEDRTVFDDPMWATALYRVVPAPP